MDEEIAKLKVIIEFMEYIFITHNTEDLLQKASEFLVQTFKLSNCSIRIEDKFCRYYTNSDLEKEYIPVEEALTLLAKDLKTPLSFDSLKTDPLTQNVKGIDKIPQATFLIPLVVEKIFLGNINLYSENSLKNHSELINMICSKFLKAYSMLLKQDQIQQSSVTDQLTGLFNRKYMDEYLKNTLARAKEDKKPTSLIIFDVDNFKKFNDTKGHLEGDRLLKEISSVTKEAFRFEDVACRYGGEEFVIILKDAENDISIKRSEELRNAIKEKTGETISIGLITCKNSTLSASEMLAKADEALYKAKRTGKDKVISFLSIDKNLGVIDLSM
ncbi:GGDEF domain-containing protein [Candidatus Woesearchaeota archaeon]|nr:GGDEF domain-containing protein [Candidatus Woesearchaeota archaeon]